MQRNPSSLRLEGPARIIALSGPPEWLGLYPDLEAQNGSGSQKKEAPAVATEAPRLSAGQWGNRGIGIARLTYLIAGAPFLIRQGSLRDATQRRFARGGGTLRIGEC